MNGRPTLGRRPALAHTAVLAFLLLTTVAATQPAAPDAAPATPPPALDASPTSANEPRARIAALRTEIARHDDLYFRKAAPEISDAAYDELKRELTMLEGVYPFAAAALAPGAPPLGDDRTGLFATYRHREPMLGLDKAYSEKELRTWHRQLLARLGHSDATLVIEPKYDGLAISVTYEKGQLVRAVTRGNGTEGDDITANVRTIRSLPTSLRVRDSRTPLPDLIELRGELLVSWAEFARLNQELETGEGPPFAHPRNLAAGTAKLGDPVEVAARKLEVVFYSWGACEPSAATPTSQRNFLAQAKAWGLPTVPAPLLAQSASELRAAITAMERQRDTLPFPIDGAVVKLDSVPLRRALGETEQAPRWAVAYKFAPDRATTTLRAITVQVGRTGVLTPVAELVPVTLAGSTVARASLHNRDTIARLDLRLGDQVVLEKAGSIIPQVTGVDLTRRRADSVPYLFPESCPSCSTPVAQLPDAAAIHCPNPACPAQLRRKLDHFSGKFGVRIDGLGPSAITTLVDRGLVRGVADLYRLRRTELLTLPGFGAKSAEELLAAIAHSKRAPLWRAINGLGLPRVGVTTAKILAARYDSLEQLAAATQGELIPLVGPATARALASHLAVETNRSEITALASARASP